MREAIAHRSRGHIFAFRTGGIDRELLEVVLHGANDTNVPVVEAEQVVASLEKRGVPVKYVLFPDEGHGWRKTTNRITSTVEIVDWFSRHLGEKR